MSHPIEVVRLAVRLAREAIEHKNPIGLQQALESLKVSSGISGADKLAARLSRLLSGGRPEDQIQQTKALLGAFSRFAETVDTSVAMPPAPEESSIPIRYRIEVDPQQLFVPHADQRDVIRGICRHLREGSDLRVLHPGPTGIGKSIINAITLSELLKTDRFRNHVVIMGTNRGETATDLAERAQIQLSPIYKVILLDGAVTLEHLQDPKLRVVAGTYQQLAQEGTVDTIREWMGRRPAIFVLDEADLVVFKGKAVDSDGESVEGWRASYFNPLIAHGVFDQEGNYREKTKHAMIGYTATPYRHDGVDLFTVWGDFSNVIGYTGLTAHFRTKRLVPVIGQYVEMDVPKKADMAYYEELGFVRQVKGKYVVVREKIREAAGSDHAVKAAVRDVLDGIIAEVGFGGAKGKSLHKTLGFAIDRVALEKHMRWQQELFDLVEKVWQAHVSLNSTTRPKAEVIKNHINTVTFEALLKRFLNSDEWEVVASVLPSALADLESNKVTSSVRQLLKHLYGILNVDARKIKGRRLVATAVWNDMDLDRRGHRIREKEGRRVFDAVGDYPNRDWPNGFAGRDLTLNAFRRESSFAERGIDVLWTIDMFNRGQDAPMASRIVGNSPTYSWTELMQRLGRILRAPNGRNPRDHSKKPYAFYSTVTWNLFLHSLDKGRQDLAKVWGKEPDPLTQQVVYGPNDPPGFQPRQDPVMLETADHQAVQLVKVGKRFSPALLEAIREKFHVDFDPAIVALAINMHPDRLVRILHMEDFPGETEITRALKNLGTAPARIARIMSLYHADLADMKTTLGDAWEVARKVGL